MELGWRYRMVSWCRERGLQMDDALWIVDFGAEGKNASSVLEIWAEHGEWLVEDGSSIKPFTPFFRSCRVR